MKRLVTFAFPIALALAAPSPIAMAQACTADECKNECVFRCIQFGGDYFWCLDVECAQVTCAK